MEYVAIDFETANKNANSACAIGLSLFDSEGEEVDSYYSLIRPLEPYFDPVCTAVHCLDPSDILKAPFLEDIWPEIRSFIGNRALVAHNAPFDIRVLRESASSSLLGGIDSDYYCTLSLSRKLMPFLPTHRLSSIAEMFDWRYRAHMAGDDAFICGRLFSKLVGKNLLDDANFKTFISNVYEGGQYPKHIHLESTLF